MKFIRQDISGEGGCVRMELFKRYVDVVLVQKKSGDLCPLYVIWEDGMKYRIDKVLDVQRRASRVGGCGIRYACLIHGRRRNLFLEKNRWFIESYQP